MRVGREFDALQGEVDVEADAVARVRVVQRAGVSRGVSFLAPLAIIELEHHEKPEVFGDDVITGFDAFADDARAALKPPSFVSLSFIFSIAFIEVRSYPCATVKTTASSPSVNRMRPEPPPERTAPR